MAIMNTMDLRQFGFQCDFEAHGKVEGSCLEGKRLVFLFAENHSDREMKRLNVLNACSLYDRGVVGCVGTEIPLGDLNMQTSEVIESRSRELLNAHKTDEGVIAYLKREQPWWYGFFEFGNTVKILRPSLAVRCVEDLVLREEMKPISNAYCIWDLGGGPHPSPDHPNMANHPHNLKREKAMIDNLLALWDETAPELAAVLNIGSAHSQRIAAGLQDRGIKYISLSVPAKPMTF
jgi:hypothetical protein